MDQIENKEFICGGGSDYNNNHNIRSDRLNIMLACKTNDFRGRQRSSFSAPHPRAHLHFMSRPIFVSPCGSSPKNAKPFFVGVCTRSLPHFDFHWRACCSAHTMRGVGTADDDDDDRPEMVAPLLLFPGESSSSSSSCSSFFFAEEDEEENESDNDDEEQQTAPISKPKSSSSHSPPPSPPPPPPPQQRDLKLVWKLVGGSLGIYTAFLYHGHLEEDLFLYQSPSDGRMFRYVWLLQVCESTAALIVGLSGRLSSSSSASSSWNMAPRFWLSGASQVFSKALTSEALATGLSFPVVVLAKSAKIVPVMCGVRCFVISMIELALLVTIS
jgi:hypothetical protein